MTSQAQIEPDTNSKWIADRISKKPELLLARPEALEDSETTEALEGKRGPTREATSTSPTRGSLNQGNK
jgi:hypothetical protein